MPRTDGNVLAEQANLYEMTLRIQGLTGLITNRFSDGKMQGIEDKQTGVGRIKKPPREPEQEFLDAIHPYQGDESKYGFPGGGIKKAMVTAGFRFAKIKKGTELKGMFFIPVEMVPILAGPPKMRRDRVVLKGGISSIAYRPEFFPWAMEIPIRFRQMITPDELATMLNTAGFSVGLGDWRVEKNGSFGQFEVVSMPNPPRKISTRFDPTITSGATLPQEVIHD